MNIIRSCLGRIKASETSGTKNNGKKKSTVIIIPSEILSRSENSDFLSMTHSNKDLSSQSR